MKVIRAILLLLALGLSTYGQGVTVTASAIKVETVTGDCRAGGVRLKIDGTIQTCQSGTWGDLSTGGSTSEISQSNAMNRSSSTANGASGRRLYDAINAWSPAIHAATKSGHGFAVLDPIYSDSSNVWQKALATGTSTLPTAIVTAVIDANTFEYASAEGEYTFTAHGLSASNVYYLQNAGGLGTSAGTVSYVVGAPTGTNTFQYFGVRPNVPVASVFGRTGAVVAASNDYTWAQIDKTTSSLADLTTRSASDLSSGSLALARIAQGGATSNQVMQWNGSTWAPATISSGGSPGGSGSELQYRSGASTFGAVTSSSVSGANVTLGGNLTLPATTSTTGILYQSSSTFLHAYGTNNTFVGTGAGNLTSSGTGGNSVLGAGALVAITTGFRNVAIGNGAGAACQGCSNNFFMGYNAGSVGTSQTFNVSIGRTAGRDNNGNGNLFIGTDAGIAATGSYNTFLGDSVGYSQTSGGSNILIGASLDAPTTNGSRQLNIGNLIYGTNAQSGGVANTSTPTGGFVGIGVVPSTLFDVADSIRGDTSSTADDTRFLLWDVTAGAFKRVTRGAADSCGTGYRCLRIAN